MRPAPVFAIILLIAALLTGGCTYGEKSVTPAVPEAIGPNGASMQYGGTAVAISVKEDDIKTHSPLARVLFFKALTLSTRYAEYNESLAYFDKTLVVDQNFTVAWLGRGAALHNMHNYDEALKSYDRALALDANDSTVWSLKGTTLNDMGRNEESAECYRKAVEIISASRK